MISRRDFVALSSASALGLACRPKSLFAATDAATFRNPILGGNHPDLSPIRVGNDFYLTHSSFDYAPGLLIWHSRDLINWKPVAAALHGYYGIVWAPYLCEHKGRFYIYFPANYVINVVHADRPEGPWSEPVSLGIGGIDPAHIAENGRRFLYLAGGQMAELNADGLSVKVKPRKVFDAWPVPANIRMECTCLEGPKVLEHNGWFYLNVAEGGTAGPATSHMAVSARSRHADGPWEYSPYNPIAHTGSRDDRWLSVGHGRLVDTPDGRWFMTVHAYENGYRSLGRQALLLPIEWTPDGWFRVPPGVKAEDALPLPVAGATQQPFDDPSDSFTTPELGLQWSFWHEFDRQRFTTGKGALELKAKGKSIGESSPLTTVVGGHSYTVEVDVEVGPGCEAGLLLYYNAEHLTGFQINSEGLAIISPVYSFKSKVREKVARVTLRIVNDREEVDFYYRFPGEEWRRTETSVEISGMQHNVLGGFLDVRPALYASGQGQAIYRNFRYWPKVEVPA
ncbi:family 43 glycosylhydrolase [Telmatobacter bradus]|uniref:family 43 glycosylhydrolase n=1 Tax=Telmatobacter bradus TaxID=474953 RepID=UPI003B428372